MEISEVLLYKESLCFALQVFRLADKNKSISLHWLTILFFHAKLPGKKFFIVLSTNMTTLSHGRKLQPRPLP